jgi:CheY-like chemotaxis protein
MARILVVDDDRKVRNAFRRVLESEGYEVAFAEDGVQGLQLYRDGGADLIITDLFMPGGGGVEMIMALKRDFPDVKIIAISGGGPTFSAESYLDVAESIGATRIFTKPIGRVELLTAVREQLKKPA